MYISVIYPDAQIISKHGNFGWHFHNYYSFDSDYDAINEKAITKKYMRYMFTEENMLQSFDQKDIRIWENLKNYVLWLWKMGKTLKIKTNVTS